MLESIWSHLNRRRSILPARDLFDADLDHARYARCRPVGALCRLIREHDQQTMHSFLWEYGTDPHIGMNISQSWGFCPSHTWSLAVMEHERMGNGLGITIVYEALLRQLRGFLIFWTPGTQAEHASSASQWRGWFDPLQFLSIGPTGGIPFSLAISAALSAGDMQ